MAGTTGASQIVPNLRARIGQTLYATSYIPAISALGAWAQVASIDIGSTNTPGAVVTGSTTYGPTVRTPTHNVLQMGGVARVGLAFRHAGAVLDLIYAHDGQLPDDPRFIAGVLNCSVRLWKSIRAVLVEKGKLVVSDDFLSNYRADDLLEECAKLSEKNRENGSKPKQNKGFQKPNAKPNARHPYPYPDIYKSGIKNFLNDDLRARATARMGAEWVASYLDPAEWRDVPEKLIVARNGTAADRIRRELHPLLRGIKVISAQELAA
jgi:hypothetical protein